MSKEIKIFISSSLSAQSFRDKIDEVVKMFNRYGTCSYATCRCENDCISGFIDGSESDNANEAIETAMLGCDLVLIILGDRVGYATEREYQIARKNLKRCFLVRVHGIGSNNTATKDIDDFIRDNNLPDELNDNEIVDKDVDVFLYEHNVYAKEIMPCDNPAEALAEALEKFIRNQLPTFLAPTYNPKTFCYADVLEANGQNYREAKNAYEERDSIDREVEPGERVITFTGMAMAGKTHAAVHLIQRLLADYQRLPYLLVITPNTPDDMIANATLLLKRNSPDNYIVLIDDIDSTMFRQKGQVVADLIGAVGQCINRDGANSYLILTAKERIDNVFGFDNLPMRRVRHIKPLTDSEWRYYRALLMMKGYDSEAIDINNQHVIGAITSQHSLDRLKNEFSVWLGDGGFNAHVCDSIRMMTLYKRDNSFNIDDAAYLCLFLQRCQTKQLREAIDERTWAEVRQQYVQRLNGLLTKGMLISVDEGSDGLVVYDEYIVENIFKPVDKPYIKLSQMAVWRFLTVDHYQPEGIKGFSAACKYFTRIIQSIIHRENREAANLQVKDILSSLSQVFFKSERFDLDKFLRRMAEDEKKYSYKDEDLNVARYWVLAFLGTTLSIESNIDEAWRRRCEIVSCLQSQAYSSQFNKLQTIDAEILRRSDVPQNIFDQILRDNFKYEGEQCTYRLKDNVGEMESIFMVGLLPGLSCQETCKLLEALENDLPSAQQTEQSSWLTDFLEESEADMDIDRVARSILAIAPRAFEKVSTIEDFIWLFDYLRRNFSRLYQGECKSEATDAHVLSKVKRYYCERAFCQMEDDCLVAVAKRILSIEVNPSDYTALLNRKMLLNALIRMLPFKPALQLFDKMGNEADNFTLSAIIGHEDMSFEMAMNFVESVVQRSRDDNYPLRPSIIVYNILLEKAATSSDMKNVLVLMEQTGHVPDLYSVGAICRQIFLSYPQRVHWLRKYMPQPEAKPRPISILAPLIETAANNYADRYAVLFCENPEEEYGITKAEQDEMRHSPRLLSLLFQYAPNVEEVDKVLKEYNIDRQEMLAHPDGNIVTEMLKNRALFPSIVKQREFIGNLGLKPTIFMNLAMLFTLGEEMKEEGANSEALIAEANHLMQDILVEIRDNEDMGKNMKEDCCSRAVLRRVHIFHDFLAKQPFVLDAGGTTQELTPIEYIIASLDKIKANKLYSFLEQTLMYSETAVFDILDAARDRNMRFSVEFLSKISNKLKLGWSYDQTYCPELNGLCDYKDLLKNLVVSLSKQKITWDEAEDLIQRYNQQNPHGKLRRTVVYFNALLQSIPTRNTTDDYLQKARGIVEMLHNSGRATIETYINYIKLLRTAEEAVGEVNRFGIISSSHADLMRIVGIVAFKASSPSEFDSLILPWVESGKIDCLNEYIVNCLLKKVITRWSSIENYNLWVELNATGHIAALPGIADARVQDMINAVEADIFTYTMFVSRLDLSINIPKVLLERKIKVNYGFLKAAYSDTKIYKGKEQRYIYAWEPEIVKLLKNLSSDELKEIAGNVKDKDFAEYLMRLQPKFKRSYFKKVRYKGH